MATPSAAHTPLIRALSAFDAKEEIASITPRMLRKKRAKKAFRNKLIDLDPIEINNALSFE